MRSLIALASVLLGLGVTAIFLSGCVEEAEVRAACKDHNGVADVEGGPARKNVTCKDGHYELLR